MANRSGELTTPDEIIALSPPDSSFPSLWQEKKNYYRFFGIKRYNIID
jgi:hypothetical protein